MALQNCPECDHRVADQAPACPSCGAPLTTPPASRRRYKAQKLAGIVVLVLGFAAVILGAKGIDGGLPSVVLGLIAMVFGLAWWAVVRLWVWWRHG